MKKSVLFAFALFLGISTASAQYKPDANTWSMELNYSPGGADNGKFEISEYGAKVRYHMNDNLVLRLRLGVGIDRDITTSYWTDADDKEQKNYNTDFTNAFSLMPGIEYHFDRFERVSPYIGGELGFIAGNTGTKTDNSKNDDYDITKAPAFGFDMRFVTGFDVYLCKGLYLGAELGLGYQYISNGRGTHEVSTGGTVNTSDGSTSASSHAFGFKVNPALRIGWNF